MVDVLVGYDPKDPHTAAAAVAGPPLGGSYTTNLSETALSKARIGVLDSVFGLEPSSDCAGVNKVIRDTHSKFKAERL